MYTKIASELLFLPNMTKSEIVDWWIAKQDGGFLRGDKITVKELMHIQEHKEQLCTTRTLLQKDREKILGRIEKGEFMKDIAPEYNINKYTFYRYFKKGEDKHE